MGVIEARRRILLSAPHPVTTAPAPVASFNTDMVGKLKSAKFGFLPVQSGSGDPSPVNNRPISGWDGLTVERTGVNIWDEEWENGSIDNSTGENIASDTQIRSKNYCACYPGVEYNIQYPLSSSDMRIFFYDGNKAFINSLWRSTGRYTFPDNAKYFRFKMAGTYGTVYRNDITINYPSTFSDYAPYTGSTYPISWQSAGTIYGGYEDLVRGVVVAEWASVDLGTLTWNMANGSSSTAYCDTFAENIPQYYQNKTAWFCSKYKSVSNSTASSTGDNYVWVDSGGRIRVKDTSLQGVTAAQFKESVSGVQLVYELATPITYALTPQIIKSLRGANNMWSTANGDTTITYWTH